MLERLVTIEKVRVLYGIRCGLRPREAGAPQLASLGAIQRQQRPSPSTSEPTGRTHSPHGFTHCQSRRSRPTKPPSRCVTRPYPQRFAMVIIWLPHLFAGRLRDY